MKKILFGVFAFVLILVLVFLMFILSEYTIYDFVKPKIKQKIQIVYDKSPLKNKKIEILTTTKILHSWDDPTISGDWSKTSVELLDIQKKIVFTNSNGFIDLNCSCVWIGMYMEYKGIEYELLSKKNKFFEKLPKIIDIANCKPFKVNDQIN